MELPDRKELLRARMQKKIIDSADVQVTLWHYIDLFEDGAPSVEGERFFKVRDWCAATLQIPVAELREKMMQIDLLKLDFKSVDPIMSVPGPLPHEEIGKEPLARTGVDKKQQNPLSEQEMQELGEADREIMEMLGFSMKEELEEYMETNYPSFGICTHSSSHSRSPSSFSSTSCSSSSSSSFCDDPDEEDDSASSRDIGEARDPEAAEQGKQQAEKEKDDHESPRARQEAQTHPQCAEIREALRLYGIVGDEDVLLDTWIMELQMYYWQVEGIVFCRLVERDQHHVFAEARKAYAADPFDHVPRKHDDVSQFRGRSRDRRSMSPLRNVTSLE